MNFIMRGVSQFKFICRTKAPYLQFAAGAVGLAATIYSVWKARPEVDRVLEEYKENKAKIEEARKKIDAGEISKDRYPEAAEKRDLMKYRVKAAFGVTKALAAPAALAVGTFSFFGASFATMRSWYIGASTAWMGSERELRALSKAVTAKYGAEALSELRGGQSKTILDADENGEVVAKEVHDLPEDCRVNSVFFGQDYTDAADGTPEGNISYLKRMQDQWTWTLDARCTRTSPGYVFLNEVRESLGYPWTADGWVFGWTKYHNEEDNIRYGCSGKVDFGFLKAKDDATKRFLMGAEEVVRLTFNVDPTPILDRCGLTRNYERIITMRHERRRLA